MCSKQRCPDKTAMSVSPAPGLSVQAVGASAQRVAAPRAAVAGALPGV